MYCGCKAVGLSIHFDSPTTADAALTPSQREVAIFEQGGRIPPQLERYVQVVDLCLKMTREKYGIPDVSLAR